MLHCTICMVAMQKQRYHRPSIIPMSSMSSKGEKKMRSRRVMGGISEFFDIMGSAIAVSSAVRNHRPARESDLKRLGIDPVRFGEIRYR